jgi:hypothetical protein
VSSEQRVLPLKVKKKNSNTKENANDSSSVYTILNRNVIAETIPPLEVQLISYCVLLLMNDLKIGF